MCFTLWAGINENAIYTLSNNKLNKIHTPDACYGIRSISYSNEKIYIACAKTNEIWCYNFKTMRFKKLCRCIGSYPCKIITYNDYYLIACCDTDTVEIYKKDGGHGLISVKLGSLISDIFIKDDACYVICTLSCELFVLDLPELHIKEYKYLDYYPYSFARINNGITVIGADGKWGRLECMDGDLNTKYQSQTTASPIDSAVFNDNLIVYGLYDNVIFSHLLSNLNVNGCYRCNGCIQIMASNGNELFIKKERYICVCNIKKGRTIKVLPFNNEISCIEYKTNYLTSS